jgi:hypothetical protein
MSQPSREPSDAQFALMERARQRAGSDPEPRRRALAPRVLGLVLAMLVALVVGVSFDRFLTALQRYIMVQTTEPSPSAVSSPPDEMPVFVVVDEPPVPERADTAQPAEQAPE